MSIQYLFSSLLILVYLFYLFYSFLTLVCLFYTFVIVFSFQHDLSILILKFSHSSMIFLYLFYSFLILVCIYLYYSFLILVCPFYTYSALFSHQSVLLILWLGLFHFFLFHSMHMFEITKEFKTIIFLYISFYLQFNPSNHLRGVVVTGSGDKILFDLGDLLTYSQTDTDILREIP